MYVTVRAVVLILIFLNEYSSRDSNVITAGPQPPAPAPQPPPPNMNSNLAPPGILQPPTQNMPHLSGIVRPMQVGPPQGMMFMQGIPGQMRPLLGIPQPGYPPFGVGPPGGMNRPPLLNPGGGPPMPPNLMALHQQQQLPPMAQELEEEPAAKKAKNLEDSLVPEGQFLASNQSPSTFNVSLPADKPELNMNGQLITLSLALTDTVTTLKLKISEAIGLAPGKQKLSREGLFFKDTNTIAFYNIGDGVTVQLSMKERGGRKK